MTQIPKCSRDRVPLRFDFWDKKHGIVAYTCPKCHHRYSSHSVVKPHVNSNEVLTAVVASPRENRMAVCQGCRAVFPESMLTYATNHQLTFSPDFYCPVCCEIMNLQEVIVP